MQTKNTKSKKVNTITAKLLISEVKKKFKAKEVKKVKETNYLLDEFNGLDVGLSIKRMREILKKEGLGCCVCCVWYFY